MPTDEVTHGTDAESSRERSGPRHAAPRKPLFTRFHMPGGRAIAMAAMPTAVLMGMGFTGSFAVADNNPAASSADHMTAQEYEACMKALEAGEVTEPEAPSPSASKDASGGDKTSGGDSEDTQGSESSQDSSSSDGKSGSSSSSSSGSSSSSDSGSDDGDAKSEPSPSPSSTASGTKTEQSATSDAAPTPSESPTSENLLEVIGGAITDIFTGGSGTGDSGSEPTASPSPSATQTSGSSDSSGTSDDADKDTSGSGSGTGSGTTGKATETVKKTVGGTAEKATGTAAETEKKVTEAAKDAAGTAADSPAPSASSTVDPANCPIAAEDGGGVDNKIAVADEPWYLQASSLTLNGADYQGIVEVQTRSGTKKKVLKYVISKGTDIGDLHQIVKDKTVGKTYHVQAGKGTTSTIRGGDTVMYTESISGNLLGLIPVTFTPDNPPPLDLPWIYFTNVKVTQAAQFGGTLTIPGMRQYTTD